MKVSLCCSWRVFFESLSGWTPVQLPVPTQCVALLLDHVIRDCSPAATNIGFAAMLTVGAVSAQDAWPKAISAKGEKSNPYSRNLFVIT